VRRGGRRAIYATLTPPQILYILNDSQSKVLFVSNAARPARWPNPLAGHHLKHVVRMDEARSGHLSFSEVRARGREVLARDPNAVRARVAEVQPSDLAP